MALLNQAWKDDLDYLLPPEIRGVPGASAALGDSDAGASPSSRQMSGEVISGSRSKVGRGDNNQALDTSAALN
ncbi:hypothetical protein RHGRI_009913 [Rhododendron griersonianum]|uniref:Uncharacterized protein n=1 Tax=Rhododendron griersonianum TaxID=479676 RepID=A0AAV6KGI6_9ERIC|nr:hypothetical protein RHGRI_009913 [Rhododendron griersonianum]